MAFVLRQQGSAGSASVNTTLTFTFTNDKAGSLIVVGVFYTSGTNTITSVTDTELNTYNSILPTNNGAVGLRVFHAPNIVGSGSNTLTLTLGGTASPAVFAAREYSGLNTSPLDVSTSTTGSAVTATSGATTNTTTLPELIVGLSAGRAVNALAGAGMNNVFPVLVPAQNNGIILGDNITNGLNPATANFTQNASAPFACGVVTFKGSGGMPSPPLNNYQFLKVGDGMSVSEKIR